MKFLLASFTAALCFLAAAPAARADGDYKECKVGDRVQDRDNKVGTVVKLEGQYSYDPKSQLITFRSGTYEGWFAKYRHAGEISLSLKPITSSTFFSPVCDLSH